MRIFKKNQVIIYVIALMLMTAGYLNFTTNQKNYDSNIIQTSVEMESKDDTQIADIGDATLVNSGDVIHENSNENEQNVLNTNTVNEQKTNIVNSKDSNVNEINENSEETSSNNSDEYFTKSKLERDTMYSQMLETYENILNSSNSLETQKQTATNEITKINELKNKIMICENLITTKGFDKNVVFVNGDSISVIIGKNQMQQDEIAQIQNIVSREMNAQIENIHISTK